MAEDTQLTVTGIQTEWYAVQRQLLYVLRYHHETLDNDTVQAIRNMVERIERVTINCR